MASFKSNRLNEDVHRELTAILRTVKDPRVQNAMLQIVRTELTNDLSYCTVYISSLQGLEATKAALEGVKSADGYIRRSLSHTLKMRKCPAMTYIADDSIEYGAKISKRLSELVPAETDEAASGTADNGEA